MQGETANRVGGILRTSAKPTASSKKKDAGGDRQQGWRDFAHKRKTHCIEQEERCRGRDSNSRRPKPQDIFSPVFVFLWGETLSPFLFDALFRRSEKGASRTSQRSAALPAMPATGRNVRVSSTHQNGSPFWSRPFLPEGKMREEKGIWDLSPAHLTWLWNPCVPYFVRAE